MNMSFRFSLFTALFAGFRWRQDPRTKKIRQPTIIGFKINWKNSIMIQISMKHI